MVIISHWPLDEDSGSTATDVRGSNDGTTNGGVTQGATGILGTTCYSFDGQDDYVSYPDLGIYDGSQEFTWSLWFRMDTDNEGNLIAGTSEYNINIDVVSGGSDVRFRWRDSGGGGHNVIGPVDTGTWHHVCGVYNPSAGVGRLYIDGVDVGTASTASLESDTGSTNVIGAVDFGDGITNFLNAQIDDVRIYDHALTPQEVQYLYEVSQRGKFTTTVK